MSIFDAAIEGIGNGDTGTDAAEAERLKREQNGDTGTDAAGKKRMHEYGKEFRNAFPNDPAFKK